MKKTFQIYQIVSNEYFIEADSYDEAVQKIVENDPPIYDSQVNDYILADTFNGEYWESDSPMEA